MTNAPTATDAPIPRRAIAYVIDAAIAGVVPVIGVSVSVLATTGKSDLGAAVGTLYLGLGVTGLVSLAWFFVYSFLQGGAGSIGMRVMKLRLVREDGGAPLGFGYALLRNIVFGLTAAIVVGYFSPLFDGSGRFQGWHDRATGALMRDVRGGAPAGAAPGPDTSAAPATTALPALSTSSGWAPGPGGAATPSGWAPGQDSLASPSGAPSLPASSPLVATPPASASTGHTLPQAPGSGPVPPAAEVDPHEATVLSPLSSRVQTADGGHEEAMITTVPGVSPVVAAPSPAIVSGPESTPPSATSVAPVPVPAPDAPAPGFAAPAPTAPAPDPDPHAPIAPIAQAAGVDDDLEETRISIPGHRLQFVWDDGARATVSGRTLFGRNPAPEAGAVVVVVRDETLSLSKTHFEAAAEVAGGWVMDRHSTNGTTIVRDGVRIACPPGERVRIRLGDAIEIGDRIVTVGGYA